MTPAQKVEVIRNFRLCFGCLSTGHRSFQCKDRKPCGIDNCDKLHHCSLHEGSVQGLGFHTKLQSGSGGCLLQIIKIQPVNCINVDRIIVFFDGGATISLIKFSTANRLGLHGTDVLMTVTKVGGVKETIRSKKYTLQLLDKKQNVVDFIVYGIDKILTDNLHSIS